MSAGPQKIALTLADTQHQYLDFVKIRSMPDAFVFVEITMTCNILRKSTHPPLATLAMLSAADHYYIIPVAPSKNAFK